MLHKLTQYGCINCENPGNECCKIRLNHQPGSNCCAKIRLNHFFKMGATKYCLCIDYLIGIQQYTFTSHCWAKLWPGFNKNPVFITCPKVLGNYGSHVGSFFLTEIEFDPQISTSRTQIPS